MSKTNNITITTIRTIEELDALAGEWDRLLRESVCNNVFLSWTWVSTWVREYVPEGQLYCLAAHSGDKLLAVAPLWLGREKFAGLFTLRVLRLFGAGEACPDHLDFIVREKDAAAASGAFWDHLFGPARKDWDKLEYHQVPVDSPVLRAISAFSEGDDRCFKSGVDEVSTCPYAELPETWDDFLGGLSKKQRWNIKNTGKYIDEQGSVELTVCSSQEDLQRDLQAMIDINRKTWTERGQTGSFATERFERFHRTVAGLFLEQNGLFLCSLKLNGKYIASLYGFEYNDRIYDYVIATERNSDKRVNVCRVLMARCVEEAINHKCVEFDMLRGDEDYKKQWSPLAHRDLAFSIFNRRITTLWYSLWVFGLDFVKQSVKTLLGRRIDTARRLAGRDV